MNIDAIRTNLESMSKDELVEFALQLGIDRGFGIMNRGMAQAFMSTIESGKTLVFIDLANIHAANHKYSMSLVDQFVSTTLDHFRQSDTWIKWGGDEIVCILDNDDNIAGFINRLDSVMADNNLYAVYGIVKTTNSLIESIKSADEVVSATKLHLEISGKKPSRDAEYIRMDSVTVYA